MPMKTLRLTGLLLLCAFLFSGALSEAVPELVAPIGVRLDTAKVTRGTISEVECYEGAVISPSQELWFEVDGKILEINVLLGDAVKAGDVLMTLDERDIVEQIDKLNERIEYLEDSRALSEQIERLGIKKMQTQQKRLESEAADQQTLALYALDIESAERAIEQGRAQFEIDLDALKSERDALVAKTGRDKIVAPFDGRVAYIVRNLVPGDGVKAYDTLLCVTNDAEKKISSTYISEMNYVGQYKIYALIGDREYPLIPIPPDLQKNLAISLKGGEIRSEFEFEGGTDEIEIGEYALVCLETKRKDDVLIIPKNALLSDTVGRFVYKVEDGVRVRCSVKIGTTTTTSVEILEGLSEGDDVYVKD